MCVQLLSICRYLAAARELWHFLQTKGSVLKPASSWSRSTRLEVACASHGHSDSIERGQGIGTVKCQLGVTQFIVVIIIRATPLSLYHDCRSPVAARRTRLGESTGRVHLSQIREWSKGLGARCRLSL
jgi:hypothetical protein